MKINTKIIIIGFALMSMIIAGCAKNIDNDGSEQIFGTSCGTVTPGYNDECCANKNKDTPHIMCVGEWKYVGGEEECAYVCETKENMAGATIDKDYCESDDDCGCGISLETADCYVGFRDYIQEGTFELPNNPGICANYCYGELGNLEIKCVDNKCVQQ